MTTRQRVVALILVVGIWSSVQVGVCQPADRRAEDKPGVTQAVFGKMQDGTEVNLFTLAGPRGIRAKIMEVGATLISLEVPDRTGKTGTIVQGMDSLEAYLARPSVAGAVVGRYANRISNARFMLDGVEYRLTANASPNHIHGGQDKCFHKALWKGQAFHDESEAGVRLTFLSRDGDEGFPGNLTCVVTYSVTKEGDLKIAYSATTDKPTVINLTNHAYFNLAGPQARDVLGHEVMINASWYTPAGPGLIPTGEIRSVEGTPLDFRQARPIGSQIA
jgi:aldose 1-epimerase